MPEPVKVLLLIPHLGGGGAERVIELLARHLPLRGIRVHLGIVTRQKTGGKEGTLPAAVQIHRLQCRRVSHAALPILRLIHSVRPQVILSGIVHLNQLLLLLRPMIPARHRLLLRQTASPAALRIAGRSALAHPRLLRRLYRRADGIICQSTAMARELSALLHMHPDKLHVLRNPVDLATIRKQMETGQETGALPWRHSSARLLSVGRLSEEKGYDLLIEAVARLRKTQPEAELLVVGDGSEKAALERQAKRLGIAEAVHFTGYSDAPWQYFTSATLYVQPSRHEGMPNALLEAAAAGLPLVSTPSTAALAELLGNQAGIWISNEVSVPSLTETLDEALRTLITGSRYAHEWLEAFDIESSIDSFARLIEASAVRDRP